MKLKVNTSNDGQRISHSSKNVNPENIKHQNKNFPNINIDEAKSQVDCDDELLLEMTRHRKMYKKIPKIMMNQN